MGGELRARIKAILPEIRQNADRAETERRVPDENVALLKTAGLFKSLQPKAYGGHEIDFPEYGECLVDLAEACASTAWACGLLANHAHIVAQLSPEAQREVWGQDREVLIASSVAPVGKAEPVPGGIRLTGSFGYSSGCDHASWAVVGYMGRNHLGQQAPCFALVPKRDYQLVDDWNTAGLRGTGSKTLRVDGAFVPDHRTEPLFGLNMGMSKGFRSHSGGIFVLPFAPVFSLAFAAVAVGIARRFESVFIDKTKTRLRAYNGAKSVEDAAVHMRIAESSNQTTAAHELLRRYWREMSEHGAAGKLPAAEDVMKWRSYQAYVTKLAIEAVDRLMAVAGGSAWFNGNEMQRLFRDVHIAGAHAHTDYGMASQTFGRFLIGLPMDPRFY
jgi:alkylation response protein AidB-like acyl-CoA dehydrogenase